MIYDKPIYVKFSQENINILRKALLNRKQAELVFHKTDFTGGHRILLTNAQLKRLQQALNNDEVENIGMKLSIAQIAAPNTGFSDILSGGSVDVLTDTDIDSEEEQLNTAYSHLNIEPSTPTGKFKLSKSQINKIKLGGSISLNLTKDSYNGDYPLDLTPEQTLSVQRAQAKGVGIRLKLDLPTPTYEKKTPIFSPQENSTNSTEIQ